MIKLVLEVNHILEGSVRKSNNKVRITAQLIRVSDDAHLWSETYDRELNDIFTYLTRVTHCIPDPAANRRPVSLVHNCRWDPRIIQTMNKAFGRNINAMIVVPQTG